MSLKGIKLLKTTSETMNSSTLKSARTLTKKLKTTRTLVTSARPSLLVINHNFGGHVGVMENVSEYQLQQYKKNYNVYALFLTDKENRETAIYDNNPNMGNYNDFIVCDFHN